MPILWPTPIQKSRLHLGSLGEVVNELSQRIKKAAGKLRFEVRTKLIIHLADAELLSIESADVIWITALRIDRFETEREPIFHIIASDNTKMLAFLKWIVPQRDAGLFWSRLTRGCAPQACPDVDTALLDHLQGGVSKTLSALALATADGEVQDPDVLLQHLRELGLFVPSAAIVQAEADLTLAARRLDSLDTIDEEYLSLFPDELEHSLKAKNLSRTKLSMLRWLHNAGTKRFQLVAKIFESRLGAGIARRLAEFGVGPHCVCETCVRLETARALQPKLEVTRTGIASASSSIDAGNMLAEESTSEIMLEEAVLQEVAHAEPAVVRDEEFLALQADHDWATDVEQWLHGPRAMDVGQSDLLVAEGSVFIVHFGGGDSQAFRQALLSGPQLRLCRDALQQNEHTCVLSSGALIFVHPDQFLDVLAALRSHTLHPFNVVVSESFEYLLHEVLLNMPCRKRPLEKKRSRREVSLSLDEPGVAHEHGTDDARASMNGDEMFDWIICEKRTFLCVAPKPRNSQSVAQSTTEAVDDVSELHYAYYRGVNPRRYDM